MSFPGWPSPSRGARRTSSGSAPRGARCRPRATARELPACWWRRESASATPIACGRQSVTATPRTGCCGRCARHYRDRRGREAARGMRSLAVAGACLALAVLAGCGSEDHSGPQKLNLKIGNLLPITGTLDPFGRPSQRAAEVAAEEIRKAAIKAGARHTVTLKSLDYKSEPADGRQVRGGAREGRVHLPDRPLRLRSRRPCRRPGQHAQARAADHPVRQRRPDLRRQGPRIFEPGRAA